MHSIVILIELYLLARLSSLVCTLNIVIGKENTLLATILQSCSKFWGTLSRDWEKIITDATTITDDDDDEDDDDDLPGSQTVSHPRRIPTQAKIGTWPRRPAGS